METLIRPATLADAERIFALVHLNRDQLVPRSIGDIVQNIDRFFVAEASGEMNCTKHTNPFTCPEIAMKR